MTQLKIKEENQKLWDKSIVHKADVITLVELPWYDNKIDHWT